MLNTHGTALLAGDRGILIVGASGSGKTTLALALIDHFCRSGTFSQLVGDDQLFIESRNGRLVAHAPTTIAGLIEIPGLGPRSASYQPVAVIDLCLRLCPDANVPRFQDTARENIAGCSIPAIMVAERNAVVALPAVMAFLKNPSFQPD